MSPPGPDPVGPTDDELLELLVHDLRAPLTTIAGYAELLAGPAVSMGEVARADALGAIRRAAARGAGLLDGLAELHGASRTDTQATGHLDVVTVLAGAADNGVGADVTVRCAAGSAWVTASPSRLTAALAAFVVDVTSRASPGRPVTITVESGPGVAAGGAEVEVSADVEARAEVLGGGLARYVLRHLVADLGGRLAVTGTPRRLSCHLPVVPPTTGAAR